MGIKTIAIIGAGGRGRGFAELINARQPAARIVAVAEPREDYRNDIVEANGISPQCTFSDWREFVARPKMCDAVVIATMDHDHVDPALQCMDLGYDILLEKPMAATLDDCRRIEAKQRETGCIFGVCHSLRYAKGFRKVKELLDAGCVGKIMSLNLVEQVAWWHQAHSFVRGNWGDSKRAAFMLLAKSCHDIDYLYYLVGVPCRKISSFGELSYFRRENAPAASGERCTDCSVESSCAYSAVRHYVNANREVWPANVVSFDHSRLAHYDAIRTGPYGRCVWKCDNDVVDHQTVNMLFEGGVTAVFTMTGFTHGSGRILRVHGTLGELLFTEDAITVKTFAENNIQRIELGRELGSHGGGDQRIVDEWLAALQTRDDSRLVANAQESLRTHAAVFAAERSRLEGKTIDMAEI